MKFSFSGNTTFNIPLSVYGFLIFIQNLNLLSLVKKKTKITIEIVFNYIIIQLLIVLLYK